MSLPIRNLITAAALMAALAPVAAAGGASARVEGPARDGRTYTVRTYLCANPAALRMTACAEGLVEGKRRSMPLTLRSTRDKGVFRFERNWPADGQWLVRLDPGGAHMPVTLTAIAKDGRVRQNRLVWEGDGTRECEAILAGDGC